MRDQVGDQPRRIDFAAQGGLLWLANSNRGAGTAPAFVEQEPALITRADVSLAAFHLSRYVRSEVEKAA